MGQHLPGPLLADLMGSTENCGSSWGKLERLYGAATDPRDALTGLAAAPSVDIAIAPQEVALPVYPTVVKAGTEVGQGGHFGLGLGTLPAARQGDRMQREAAAAHGMPRSDKVEKAGRAQTEQRQGQYPASLPPSHPPQPSPPPPMCYYRKFARDKQQLMALPTQDSPLAVWADKLQRQKPVVSFWVWDNDCSFHGGHGHVQRVALGESCRQGKLPLVP